jgi:hypothetical protein
MATFRFDNFAKAFCIFVVLYIYLFILSDFLRLNPNDDGDGAFIGMVLGIFPALAVILYILFEGGKKSGAKKVAIGLSLALMAGTSIFLIILNSGDDVSEIIMVLPMFFIFLLQFSVIIIPLAAYLIYKKTRDTTSFILLAVALCILGLSVYPAKDYIQAKFLGDPCATKRLIMKGYSEFRTEVYGSVVCIAKDRGYPSETYKWEVLSSADAKTFENLDDEYSRDKNFVFYRGRAIDADSKTFTLDAQWQTDQMANFIRGGIPYKRDDQNIYFEGQKVPVKDISKFRIIDFCDSYLCATDGISVFKEGKIVPGVNLNSLFSFQACQYTKDDKRVYYGGEVIEGANVDTFNVYGEDKDCYAYDKSGMYYEGEVVLEGVSSRLQEVSPGDPFSPDGDGKNIYYDGKRLDIDIDTFQYLGKGVSKDAVSVYYGADRIEGADAATFELIPASVPQAVNMCAKDKNHMYFDGEVDEHPLCTGEIFE